MSDLISKSALLEAIGKEIRLHDEKDVENFLRVSEIISEQPILCDTDKFVADMNNQIGASGEHMDNKLREWINELKACEKDGKE